MSANFKLVQEEDKVAPSGSSGSGQEAVEVVSPSKRQHAGSNTLCLTVANLSYDPAVTFADLVNDSVQTCCPQWTFPAWTWVMNHAVPSRQHMASVAPLRNVTFAAPAGKVTAIMSNTYGERRTLIDLIAGRRKLGAFEGHILLGGAGIKLDGNYAPINCNSSKEEASSSLPASAQPSAPPLEASTETDTLMSSHIAFVPRSLHYLPGLTFLETLRYAARLRMKFPDYLNRGDRRRLIEERVEEVLQLMGLEHCQQRILPDEAETRGELGCDLRRLSIAVEIVSLPSVIIVDDPQHTLDPGIALGIFASLKALAQRGHVVLLSIPKPSPMLLAHVDSIVLLAEGHSIYAAAPQDIRSYFCNPKIGFSCRPEVDLMDWILDIAAGTERPTSQRHADDPAVQQEKFEASPFFVRPYAGVDALTAFPQSMFRYWGYYTKVESPLVLLHRLGVAIERGFLVKTREYGAIQKGLGGSILVALIVGYLQFQIGSYGQYTMSLITFPYVNTSNVTALLFFVGAFLFTQQVLTVQYVCRKVSTFRHEQSVGVSSTLIFALTSFVSEIPFVVFYSFIFANIIYYMSALGVGLDNYLFFTRILCTFATIGFATAFTLASLLRHEILVRDTFLVFLFLMIMLSGFPFQLSFIRSYVADLTVINPMRWAYEALMSWKFGAAYYKDGDTYLAPYAFDEFNPHDVFPIFGNFFVFALCLSLVVLLPLPNFLRPAQSTRRTRRSLNYSGDEGENTTDSFDLIFPRTRTTDLTKPLIFARESSLSGSQRLSISLSQTGAESLSRGPTVAFHNLTYRIKDRTKKAGFKLILDRISGQFDWGKLSCILGAPQSGRSSLLHILAGDRGLRSEVQGSVFYDGELVSENVPLWQRCALVEASDEQIPSLTVRETITYAMQLRCINRKGLAVVEENVSRTLDILLLAECQTKKVKYLNPGERRRLSIAEEIVHGPSLLLIDEPDTTLSALDASILYRTFREMVNQDKTVIATLHQPSAAVFNLFDTIVLLSSGRVVYHGKASGAVSFFNSSPSAFSFSGYNNTGDFLTDISGGRIRDSKGLVVGSEELCAYYKSSEQYRAVYKRLQQGDKYSLLSKNASTLLDATGNPALAAQSSYSNKDARESNVSTINGRLLDEAEDDEHESNNEMQQPLGYMYMYPQIARNIYKLFTGCRCSSEDIQSKLLIASVVFNRARWGLFNRKSVVFGSIFAHILLACLIGWIMGNSSTSIYNCTSFFAVGTLLLILGNVQLISMLFQTHQVFLKEHSRGLYSNLLYWSVAALPLYLLRLINGVLYASIAYELLGLAGVKGLPADGAGAASIEWFFILCTTTALLAGTMMSEAVVYMVPDIRSAYLIIPAFGFVQFAFSGLFLKPVLLPRWLAPWAPSISVIRWAMQAEFINQFDGSSITPFGFQTANYSAFSAFLSLFGWGGKTKWYCFYMIVAMVAIFRFAALFAAGLSSQLSRGGRKFRKKLQ